MAEGARDRAAVRGPAAAAAPTAGPPLTPVAAARRLALARDPWRILAWLGVRLATGEVAILVGMATPGTIGAVVTVAGIAVLAYVVLLSLHVLTLRLEVEPNELHVASVLSRRRYVVHEGSAAMLPVDRRKGVFSTQLGSFGLEIGPGRTSAGDIVDVLRLAPDAPMLVITASPRPLAVAPASPRALLRALELRGTAQSVATMSADDQPLAVDASR